MKVCVVQVQKISTWYTSAVVSTHVGSGGGDLIVSTHVGSGGGDCAVDHPDGQQNYSRINH